MSRTIWDEVDDRLTGQRVGMAFRSDVKAWRDPATGQVHTLVYVWPDGSFVSSRPIVTTSECRAVRAYHRASATDVAAAATWTPVPFEDGENPAPEGEGPGV